MKLRVMICAMAAGAALFAADTTSPTFGLIRVTDTASSNTVIGVPWKNIGDDGNATLSNLVSTANLEAGDIVYLYENDTWCGYELSAAGVWEALTTVNGTDVVNPSSADVKRLARGTGLIIQRADITKPIYLCGRCDSDAATTEIAANSLVLVANSSDAEVTIGSTVGAAGDQIRVPLNGGAMKIYEKDSVKGWGSWEETVTMRNGRPKATRAWQNGCSFLPGMGGWYVSGTAGTSITWGN